MTFSFAAKQSEKSTPTVGGQAVIEGVMMRSPDAVAVAVRGPDGKIVLKRNRIRPWTKKAKVLALPFVRGGVILLESLILGVRALNFSSAVAMHEAGRGKGKTDGTSSDALVIGTVVVAFAAGLALFFYLPLKLTEWLGVQNGTVFNLVDGGIRLVIFLAYLGLISLWKEMRRIFEYHGAEHKSIFAFEAGRPLTLRGVRAFSTHHPRCGTSFLLVVMLVSIAVFIPLGRPDGVAERLVRFLFLPVIGGVSYEIIKLSGSKRGKLLARLLVAPGLWLQRITTREPDAAQLEVALVALKSSLNLEVGSGVKRTSAS